MTDAKRTYWSWLAAEGQRHAVDRSLVTNKIGTNIATLCGKRPLRSQPGEYDWLWPTCRACWNSIAERIGAPTMGSQDAGECGKSADSKLTHRGRTAERSGSLRA